jgi:glucose/mannose-6-phosphate isomerase
MENLIAAFPHNIASAIEFVSKLALKKPTKEFKNLVFIGMGGSGIGAKIVSEWIQNEISIPIQILQEYTIPKYVDEYTLVIACSYSGNTEETLISAELAKNAGANIVGICSGGKLKAFCAENNYYCLIIPGGNPPRTAIAYSIVYISYILENNGLIDSKIIEQLKGSTSTILNNLVKIKDDAKKLAVFLKDKVGIFYSTTEYEPIMIRARQQFNENSKLLCWHHVIPEMNHNELVGWGGGNDGFAPVFFDTKDMNIQNKTRFSLTINEVKKYTSNLLIIDALGANKVEKSFYLIHLVDWASLYLANLKPVDPMEIKCIDFLKTELAKVENH